jgi:hypothetical protein
MKQRFTEIYATNEWLYGSGEGSLPLNTGGYVNFLNRFMRRHRITSVVDLGCGDWQFSRFVDWSGINYQGYDVVEALTSWNRARFGSPNVTFHTLDGSLELLPGADLLLVKDVFQHWSNRAIHAFLPRLGQFQYSLITNCVHPWRQVQNGDIVDGDFRYIDLRLPPFEVHARNVYSFTDFRPWWRRPFKKHRWLKRVLLVVQPGDKSALRA